MILDKLVSLKSLWHKYKRYALKKESVSKKEERNNETGGEVYQALIFSLTL